MLRELAAARSQRWPTMRLKAGYSAERSGDCGSPDQASSAFLCNEDIGPDEIVTFAEERLSTVPARAYERQSP